MKRQKICGVYTITNIKNGKMYVGCSTDCLTRWSSHKSDLRKPEKLKRLMKQDFERYGEAAFVFAVVAECSIENLVIVEQRFIDNLKPEYNTLLTACRKGKTPPGSKPKPYNKGAYAIRVWEEERNQLNTLYMESKRLEFDK